MIYEDAIAFYTELGKFSHEPGLEMMKALCGTLKEPQKGQRFVHIAGTNGKGSCAAMTAAMLRAAGLRAGLYTSPDLTDMRERVQTDGRLLSKPDFLRLTRQVAAAAQDFPALSFFEAVTALAFLAFREANCDCSVLECGLGGRFDATNVIDTPACAAVMPIGLDHTAILGGTLAAIAGEKAGVIKPGGDVVTAPQPDEAMAVLRDVCARRGARLHPVGSSALTPGEFSPAGQSFSYKDLSGLRIRLLGAHQLQNACAAVEIARVLELPERAVREGLASAAWPCRFELARSDPPFVLDGAHNPHGAAALAAGLRQYFPGQKFVFLMGVMADKDYGGILELMEPLAERFVCFAPPYSRALTARSLAAQVRSVPAQAADTLEQAVALCLDTGRPVCAFGSLYYIGYVRKMLLGE